MGAEGGSSALIQQLLEAERKAEELITKAKQDRLSKLRQAKDKAEEELKTFREEQDQKFKLESQKKEGEDPAVALRAGTEHAVSMVKQDYANNKDKTVAYVANKVLDDQIGLTTTQVQAL